MYKWNKVKQLKREGCSIHRIAKDLNLSRNTVRKYLSNEETPKYPGRKFTRNTDEYEADIKKMIQDKYIGTRIYREIKKKGYRGSQSSVDRHIRDVYGDRNRGAKVTTRFETEPGVQSQYDWKEWEMYIGGELTKVYFHVVLLGYSRKKHYTYSLSIKGEDITRAIQLGFEGLGGTTNELLMDNAKQMVIMHEEKDIIRYNDEFLKFCGMYGITPNACQNYRARTKGKCERPFHYFQEQFLRGLNVDGFAELDRRLSIFNQEVNQKENRYLKESPDQRFEREKFNLNPLPVIEPSSLFTRELRRVSYDGYISWDGQLYAIPMKYAGKSVFIEKILGTSINVYEQSGIKITRHTKRLSGLYQPVHEDHIRINEKMKKNKIKFRKELYTQFITEYGGVGETFLNGLRDQYGENMRWHMNEILSFITYYEQRNIIDVLAECIQIGQYSKTTVSQLLGKFKIKTPTFNTNKLNEFPPEDITRSLNDYRLEVKHG